MTHEEYTRKAQAYRAMVEDKLTQLMDDAGAGMPRLLREAMSYSLMAGGKRLRPVLLLAAVDLLGGRVQEALTCACALEMIHTYSLIHDDLPGMDDDTLRRGKPTCHVQYGEGQAILAGDGLLTYAFECVLGDASRRGAEAALRHMRALGHIASAAGCGGMVAGQCADLACERAGGTGLGGVVDEGEWTPDAMLEYIHRRKTARMLIAPFEAACELTCADERLREALLRFAEPFGLLFQVVDDYLDACGSSEKLGKTVGKDQSSGKLTYVSLYGVERTLEIRDRLTAQAREALADIPGSGYLACALEEMAYRDR